MRKHRSEHLHAQDRVNFAIALAGEIENYVKEHPSTPVKVPLRGLAGIILQQGIVCENDGGLLLALLGFEEAKRLKDIAVKKAQATHLGSS